MRVRYIADHDTLALIKNKIYDVISIEKHWYRIMTELDEDYLFPPEAFEVIEESKATEKRDDIYLYNGDSQVSFEHGYVYEAFKDTDDLGDFYSVKDESWEWYRCGVDFFESNFILIQQLPSIPRSALIWDIAKKDVVTSADIKALEQLSNDDGSFWNDLILVSDFANATMDLLGIRKYKGDSEYTLRLIEANMDF